MLFCFSSRFKWIGLNHSRAMRESGAWMVLVRRSSDKEWSWMTLRGRFLLVPAATSVFTLRFERRSPKVCHLLSKATWAARTAVEAPPRSRGTAPLFLFVMFLLDFFSEMKWPEWITIAPAACLHYADEKRTLDYGNHNRQSGGNWLEKSRCAKQISPSIYHYN